jgi:hypothetical protein
MAEISSHTRGNPSSSQIHRFRGMPCHCPAALRESPRDDQNRMQAKTGKEAQRFAICPPVCSSAIATPPLYLLNATLQRLRHGLAFCSGGKGARTARKRPFIAGIRLGRLGTIVALADYLDEARAHAWILSRKTWRNS